MASTNTHLEPAPALSPNPLVTGRSRGHRPTRHPILVAASSHPAATALLVAGVILAIILVFRAFAHDPNRPIIDYGPAATMWQQPIAANECVPVATTTDHEYDVARDYTITDDPAPSGADAASQARSYTACMGWGTVTPQTSASDFTTSRHATEDTRRLSSAQVAGAKELSVYYTDNGFSPYQRAPEGVNFRDAHTTTSQRADEGPIVYTPIVDPNTAVGLADGRVAMPTTYLIADDRSWNQTERQPLPITTGLTIWANVDGTWLIDEELPLCIGDCTSLWDYLESRVPDAPSATPASPAPGTPASPVASAITPFERRMVTF